MDTMDVVTILLAWLLTEYLTIEVTSGCERIKGDVKKQIELVRNMAGVAAIMVLVIFAIYSRYNQ